MELPAGMLDDEKGDFVGTAVREVSILASEYACTEICVLMQDSQHCIYPVFARFWSRLHRL